MKHSFTLLFVIWWVLSPLAVLRGIGVTQFFGAGVVVGGTSYVQKESQTGTTVAEYAVGNSTLNDARGTKFTAASSYTLNRVDMYVNRNATGTITYTCQIWSHDSMANLPSAMIGSASAAVSVADFPDTEGIVSFYPSATIVSGTVYYIVLRTSAASSNYGRVIAAGVTGGQVVTFNDPTWSATSSTRSLKYVNYGDS